MWHPQINFITLHYAYIILCGILGLIVIYPYGNVAAIDAYFFGASASTESGLNTVDVKDLKTYQQLYLYFIPIITNLGFVNILVVAVRLYWFKQHLVKNAGSLLHQRHLASADTDDVEGQHEKKPLSRTSSVNQKIPRQEDLAGTRKQGATISFADDERQATEHDAIKPVDTADYAPSSDMAVASRRRTYSQALDAVESVTADLFVLGPAGTSGADSGANKTSNANAADLRRLSTAASQRRSAAVADLPFLSASATMGRNSNFQNLTAQDREMLGGLEYRSLKVLLKIVLGYFFGLHLLGVIFLVPWIHRSPAKYTDYLAEMGQDKTWWAFYSAQTMVNNLGFTLTPDSMASFKDATWPMLCMTFLAFAGNTAYPIFLRLAIWVASKLTPSRSSLSEPLKFLLDHPRRCYTLLFPSKPTWILFGILFWLNFIDVILIVTLDLDNPAVNDLALGPRILAALFQAASSRHTGTSTFNLADVNPAVQVSLLVMMYIAVLPIAISIRASNTYEERSLGLYTSEADQQGGLDETHAASYVATHLRNQLSFDLWYIFLGTFCICAAESKRIMDKEDPAFQVFAILFEVTSAYGNVGLSLGHPSVLTSLSGLFTTFSKLVICAMMIRGRHRCLPYNLDRAIILPGQSPSSLTSGGDSVHSFTEDSYGRNDTLPLPHGGEQVEKERTQ